ncbi:MAG TPA: DUF1579 domain-containing protein, partial [Planctomycetota bacterium]|nr:DUF1579 domain-containing protein [Planctomycetota bacterium]
GLVVGLVAGAALSVPEDAPKMPAPEKEHAWLEQLAGEWEFDAECIMEPGKPPMKSSGTETGRMIGEFWIVSEVKSTFMDTPMTGILTLGFDPEKKKYVGTWVDSMTSHQWKYEGTVDAAGKVLKLESEGPVAPGKLSKFKEVIELKGKDQKVFTSSMLGDDGKWSTFATFHYRRKKVDASAG